MKKHKMSEFIKALRCEKGLTQAELAKRCGLSQQYICNLESGYREPNPRVIEKLAAELGKRYEMYFGIGHMPEGEEEAFLKYFGEEKAND